MVPGTERGSLVLHYLLTNLAALNKVEALPWDERGWMTEAYEGRTGPDYDELLDTLAAAGSSRFCGGYRYHRPAGRHVSWSR